MPQPGNVCRSRVRNRTAPARSPRQPRQPAEAETVLKNANRAKVGGQLPWRVCDRIGRRLTACRERRPPARHSRWRTASRRRAPFHRGTSAMGPRFLNQVLQLRGVHYQARSTCTCRSWPAASRRSGLQVGARIARHVKGGVWLEFGADVGFDPLGFDDEVRDRVENTRADFETAFKALAASAPAIIAASTVTSTADFAANGGRVIVSGVVQYRGDGPVMRPYLLAGIGRGGILRRSRDADAHRHLPLHTSRTGSHRRDRHDAARLRGVRFARVDPWRRHDARSLQIVGVSRGGPPALEHDEACRAGSTPSLPGSRLRLAAR